MPAVEQKPNLDGQTAYEKINTACTYILNNQKKLSRENTLSSAELFSEVKLLFPLDFDEEFSKNTFYQYLSRTVHDTESLINCEGRKKGYYLSEVIEEIQHSPEQSSEVAVAESETVTPRKRVEKECLLYPVLESWLITQGYQAADVSSGRALGKWGNPDVAGINALDVFGNLSVELVTIEAKVSLENWEQWIFEAVSHRRFANRSYFAFAHPEEAIAKIPQDLRYYAELYGIGILMLSLDNQKYQSLIKGEIDKEALEHDDIDVIEIYSAPYHFVQPKYQFKFCTALGIKNIKDLYHWGKAQG